MNRLNKINNKEVVLDIFVNRIQQQKMKELWDNKEDDAWEISNI